MRVGFVGVGLMGEPMARNLLRAGHQVVVWNRSDPAAVRLVALGATRAATPYEAIRSADVTIEMLSTERAIDEVLRIDGEEFAAAVAGRGLVHMSTTSADRSLRVQRAVRAAGGWYVEAPVSGSRVPAEQGRLVAMVAGDDADLDRVAPLLEAMCAQVLRCGAPPSAALMKFAVNTHLIAVVTSLVESWHFARSLNLDLDVFASAIANGQMGSPITAVKLDKLRRDDFAPQAAMPDVHRNACLIADAARDRAIDLPLHELCLDLFGEALRLGHDAEDMISVVHAVEHRQRGGVPARHPEEAARRALT
ncbi:NAD(P)-dependent oxidoreductase [Luteipulveratus sp. YIM 133132]|uniref:NAD(P)-dependent oxidoreductase n=1 Tax=Luteipulveratus flavus TaxID=3031728 RepID=UPI0023B01718|nr:NAD(P)-dependent oxidoreductase [Luteipulveratus sp. YIM 133132]MDE9364047.1 NAD(P)-dependent oxidoreductase [Luteipulveratus sp. YIM 133132]